MVNFAIAGSAAARASSLADGRAEHNDVLRPQIKNAGRIHNLTQM